MDGESRLGERPNDALVDEVATLVEADDWMSWRRLYENDDRLRAPAA